MATSGFQTTSLKALSRYVHIDQLDEPYLDLEWALDVDSSLSRDETVRRDLLQSSANGIYGTAEEPWWPGSKEDTRCVLMYPFPVPDQPHHVSIDVIKDVLLGIR